MTQSPGPAFGLLGALTVMSKKTTLVVPHGKDMWNEMKVWEAIRKADADHVVITPKEDAPAKDAIVEIQEELSNLYGEYVMANDVFNSAVVAIETLQRQYGELADQLHTLRDEFLSMQMRDRAETRRHEENEMLQNELLLRIEALEARK